jgi:uncharacterized protein YndB with AHSA1/START domain
MSQPIHQEVTFETTPARLYEALMDSAQHAAFTGGPAQISPEVGGTFTCHGGHIEGRHIELVPNERIVQAWRPANWPQGVYSVVRFELKAEGKKTRVTLTHTGLPAEGSAHISEGWKTHYWEPLAKYLAG